ncbi:MAG: DNA adenine methylase [Pseudomonadota bacterium]
MGISIGYMGTKRHLAPLVAEVISSCPNGPALDAFSGMCAVGSAIGSSRQVWNNDVQHFASHVAKALFTSRSIPPSFGSTISLLEPAFQENKLALSKRYEKQLADETAILATSDMQSLLLQIASPHIGNSNELELERQILNSNPTLFPYRLCAITFAHGYFGLLQAIEIDSIRYSIDQSLAKQHIDTDQHRWMLIALCQTAVKVAASTGHFAQYLKPNPNNFAFIKKQRSKSVWQTWLQCLSLLSPVGSMNWRKNNKVFNENILTLLAGMQGFDIKPAVIYVDPPYTEDQYSRYYHVWETLTLYDYPPSLKNGRYRPDRFRTSFSIKTNVAKAMEELVMRCNQLGAELVMSYPENGLLYKTGITPQEILQRHYKKVEISHCIDYQHSTLGASNGSAKHAVKELIYWARN